MNNNTDTNKKSDGRGRTMGASSYVLNSINDLLAAGVVPDANLPLPRKLIEALGIACGKPFSPTPQNYAAFVPIQVNVTVDSTAAATGSTESAPKDVANEPVGITL